MDSGTLARWRLERLLLLGSTARDVATVIGRLTVVQGQDYLPATWSLAQRTLPVSPSAEVDAAFDRGEVVRTHVLRPTWHLVAPGDLRWLLTATADRVHQRNQPYYRRNGIDPETTRVARQVLETALAGRTRTRTEMQRELAGIGIEASGERLAYLLMQAELDGVLVSGPRLGRQQTYALLDERVPGSDERDVAAARAELALRYVRTRGPVTVADLAVWATLTIAQARSAVQAVGERLRRFEVDGREYWVPVDSEPGPASTTSRAHLLQAYDEYVMSYRESRDVLAGGGGGASPPGLTFMHALVVDGRLVGHWRYERAGDGRPKAIETWTYRPLSRPEKTAVADEVDRFATFAAGPVTWSQHPGSA